MSSAGLLPLRVRRPAAGGLTGCGLGKDSAPRQATPIDHGPLAL